MSKGAHWTAAEIDRLSMLARHHTLVELSNLLSRSDASVRRRLEGLGMSAKPTPRTHGRNLKVQIHKLCDQGKRPTEIARILNTGIDYVSLCARIYLGTGVGVGAVIREPARDRKHLQAIAKASKGKGFPYCVARAS